MTPVESRVTTINGTPTLFINGEPHTGLMFWHAMNKPDAVIDLRNFARAGVHPFTTGLDAGRCLQPDGSMDFSGVEKRMAAILDANPQALVLPRVGLEPPRWWAEQYPEEMRLHVDIGNGEEIRWQVSFASERWREDLGKALGTYIRFCEERYPDHIMGYHLCAGDCGEWSYMWKPVMSDFSEPQLRGFRAWLRERYHDEVSALREAWASPEVTFETACISRDRLRPHNVWPRPWSLHDPAAERATIDYLIYHSEVVADAILYFSRITKATLADVGRDKICAVFYGYHFANLGAAPAFHNSGHHAYGKLLESPDVDVLCAPESYQERQPGGMFLSQLATGSMRLYNTLFYNEDDTFTHLAKHTPWRYCCANAWETIQCIRRNVIGTLREGGTHWWMDHDSDGWYRDDAVMAEVAATQRLTEKWVREDRRSTAQVAVVVSEESQPYLRYDPDLIDAFLARQMAELTHIGAPFDVYRVADLERLFSVGWGEQYRMFIFLDAVYLSPSEREVIRGTVAGGDRTLFWTYAAGLATERALSPEAMGDITGLRTCLRDLGGPAMVETYLTGSRLVYGTDREIGPILYGDDPDATVLGWELHRGAPCLLERQFNTWRSVWSAAPIVPSVVLRYFAAEAGAHMYSDAGDQVFAWPGVLALHAGRPGERTIRLAEESDVRDAFTGQVVATGVREVPINVKRGETLVWEITGRE